MVWERKLANMHFNDLNRNRTVGIMLKVSRRKQVRPWEKIKSTKQLSFFIYKIYIQYLQDLIENFGPELKFVFC